MIEMLQETTAWSEPTFNGVYHVSSEGHLIGYDNDIEFKKFTVPMKHFSKTGRKFVKIGEYPEDDLPSTANIVVGSKGQEYIVDNGTCTCPGFKFRGSCKHV